MSCRWVHFLSFVRRLFADDRSFISAYVVWNIKKGGNVVGLKIIKPVFSSAPEIVLSPTITRFFYELEEPIAERTIVKIDTAKFFDDSGETVESLPPLNLNNSYLNVYINGVIQMDDNFAYTAGETGVGNLMITVPGGSDIAKGTPIIAEVINYDPVFKSGSDQ